MGQRHLIVTRRVNANHVSVVHKVQTHFDLRFKHRFFFWAPGFQPNFPDALAKGVFSSGSSNAGI